MQLKGNNAPDTYLITKGIRKAVVVTMDLFPWPLLNT